MLRRHYEPVPAPAEQIVPVANGRCNGANLIEQLKNGARAMAGDPCARTPPAATGTKPLGVRLFWD